MSFIFFSIILSLSTLTLFMKSPLSLTLMILMSSLLTALTTMTLLKTSWISMLFFLIFLGGLMIMIMYIVIISYNKMFKPNLKLIMTLMSITIISLIVNSNKSNILIKSSSTENLLLFFYSKSNIILLLFIFIYLLIMLLVIINMIFIKKMPFRSYSG
uniref:NADH dehydrogenase subunit 6 n=1 Tax=Spelaeomysis bottazzii TaxID=2970448 RepID=UPI002176C864|nr:NADH dehydrogenase subunit 6 [Spelaeomysis bottazzii]UUL70725.1 NADH dehydrogenase subunit 6 [Spelaeomysis bottazzii]